MVLILVIAGAVFFIFAIMAITGAPLVPSHEGEVEEAFTKLYPLSKNDYLVDLGSGSGRILSIAAKHGAKGYGIELNPIMVLYSKIRLHRNKKVQVVCGDMFSWKYPSKTTVVYVFGVERDSKRTYNAIKRQADNLHKDLYVITYAMRLKEIEPIKTHRAHLLYKVKGEKA